MDDEGNPCVAIKQLNRVVDKGNSSVAIKQLNRVDDDFKRVAEREAQVLEMLKGFKSPHWIKAIAYYRLKGEHYFIFPWADMGNLRQFWKLNSPKAERQDLIWAFTQLTGLAVAMKELHHLTSESEGRLPSMNGDNCRHGDLKAENILCFKPDRGHEDRPRLVIADLGLARVHTDATGLRDLTQTTASTVRYSAPELAMNPNAARSRRFDIWSLGCIFLEFTVWLLYDKDGLGSFCGGPSDSSNEPFYELETQKTGSETRGQQFLGVPEGGAVEKKTARVHRAVIDWISYIKDDLRCSGRTAVGFLVDLIADQMLKVELGEANLEVRIKRPPTWTADGQPTSNVTGGPRYRVYAPDVSDAMESILSDLTEGKLDAIGTRSSNGEKFPPGLSHRRAGGNDHPKASHNPSVG